MKIASSAALLCLTVSTLAMAGPIATFTGGTYTSHGAIQTVGWSFTTNSAITVTDLYWYDPTGSLTQSFPVDIWDSSGSPVMPATSVGFGAGTWDSGTDFWGEAVSPFTLAAGATYTIGGLIGVSDPILGSPATGLTTSAVITFDDAEAIIGGSLTDPTVAQNTTGYFGPDFGASSATPEPASVFFAITCLAAITIRRRAR